MSVIGLLRKAIGWIWAVLDAMRRLLSLLLTIFVFLFVVAVLAPHVPQVPRSGALILAPEGALVDQLTGDPLDQALARARGLPLQETLLRDLVEAMRRAKDDDRIKVLVLQLDGLGGSGLSKLQELADEILLFKESGKPVVAVANSYTRNQYYLASVADEVYMHPMGYVYVDGYSRYLPYYRAAIENLRVDFHVWRVGAYKSFVEPITRDDMSEEDREAASDYLGALWDAYQADVTAARGLSPDALQSYADNAVQLLADSEGNTGSLALMQELVDELLPQDEIDAHIKSLIGDVGDDDEAYPRIDYADYLRATRRASATAGGDEVAVLVASGTILDGVQPPGTVGGESLARMIHEATDDDDVKALVLRVDSPGGSAFASEVILRQLEVFRQSGRPLVVSMGSVAASGGYWISMGADEIWASPVTLTGSIGVGATLPTAPRTLDALGIHIDGLGTTELAGQLNLARPLGPDIDNLIGQSVQYSYREFVTKVAQYREQDVETIDAVAQGRVWIGARAQELGLVDRIGDIDDAIASAAELAGLGEDEYTIHYVEREPSFAERIAVELVRSAAPVLGSLRLQPQFSPRFQELLDIAAEPLKWVDSLNDPRNIYAYCFCDVR